MQDFINALEKHLADTISLPELQRLLARALKNGELTPEALLETLETQRRLGTLKESVYLNLRHELQALLEDPSLFTDLEAPTRPTQGATLTGATDAGTRLAPGTNASLFPAWEAGEATPVRVGALLKGRFVLEGEVASGGMGVVYRARDLRKEEARDRNPYVAIKVLGEDFRRYPESFVALQREARKAQTLAHPNVVTVFDFDRDGGTVFMTMELLEGESLASLLKRLPPGGLAPERAFPILEGMAQALAHAHRKGIMHADFKPGNIFVCADGTVKVLDFGIARALPPPGQKQEATVFDPARLGALTPTYASAEMLEGQAPDPRDDIYSLACVTYELLTGRHPFNRLTAVQARDSRLVPERPPGLGRRQWAGLRRGLALNRAERTPSVEHLLAEVTAPSRGGRPALVTAAVLGALGLGGLAWHTQERWAWWEERRADVPLETPGTPPTESPVTRATEPPTPIPVETIPAQTTEQPPRETPATQATETPPRLAEETPGQPPGETPTTTTTDQPPGEVAETKLEPPVTPPVEPPVALTPPAILERLYQQRDAQIQLEARIPTRRLVIGRDTLDFSLRSSLSGYLYVLLVGTDDNSLYLLFPNALDEQNRIEAGRNLKLPRADWMVTAEGPPGTNHLLAIVSPVPRDFAAAGLRPGHPFGQFDPERRAEITREGAYDLYAGQPRCPQEPANCAEGFGAARFEIEEIQP